MSRKEREEKEEREGGVVMDGTNLSFGVTAKRNERQRKS